MGFGPPGRAGSVLRIAGAIAGTGLWGLCPAERLSCAVAPPVCHTSDPQQGEPDEETIDLLPIAVRTSGS